MRRWWEGMYSLSDGKTIDQGMRDEKGQEKKYFSNDIGYPHPTLMFVCLFCFLFIFSKHV